MSDDADIGLCGNEAIMYLHDKLDDNIKSFASLTKRDGQFLVLKNNINYENLNSIEGLTILAGRTGGMPLVNFKEAIKGINNVNIDTSVDFANLTSAFISTNADGVNLFEPAASTIVKNGYGFIADSIGKYSKVVPYTTFNAKESFIKNNKELIKKFYNGITLGLEFVNTHTSKEIAKIVYPEFPDTSIEDLTVMIENYKNADSWFTDAVIPKHAIDNLETMLIENKELNTKIPYKDLVYEVNNN